MNGLLNEVDVQLVVSEQMSANENVNVRNKGCLCVVVAVSFRESGLLLLPSFLPSEVVLYLPREGRLQPQLVPKQLADQCPAMLLAGIDLGGGDRVLFLEMVGDDVALPGGGTIRLS